MRPHSGSGAFYALSRTVGNVVPGMRIANIASVAPREWGEVSKLSVELWTLCLNVNDMPHWTTPPEYPPAYMNLFGKQVDIGHTWNVIHFLLSVHMAVSPLWRGPSSTHGFTLDGKP